MLDTSEPWWDWQEMHFSTRCISQITKDISAVLRGYNGESRGFVGCFITAKPKRDDIVWDLVQLKCWIII